MESLNTLPSVCRLSSKKDFEYLKTHSKKVRTRYLIVYYCKNSIENDVGRIAISASKKVGKANVRNRVKRILRESFRKSELKTNGYDHLFVVLSKKFKETEINISEMEIKKCFAKIKIRSQKRPLDRNE